MEDAGTQASFDGADFDCVTISGTPKAKKNNWLAAAKKTKQQSKKNCILKRSKAIDKKTDKTKLAKERLNLKKAKKEKVQTKRDLV